MPVDINAGEQFVYANARLLDRHRLAVLLHGAPVAPVLQTLHAYRNADGGFGHALEPDVRAPQSETAATLHALEVLAEIEALDNPMVKDAAAWAGTIAHADGGLPFVLPTLRPTIHTRRGWPPPTRGHFSPSQWPRGCGRRAQASHGSPARPNGAGGGWKAPANSAATG